MTNSFPIGQRVYNKRFGYGTIIAIEDYEDQSDWLVQFDIREEALHDGGGLCPDHTGWYFGETTISLTFIDKIQVEIPKDEKYKDLFI